ncbi:methionyl-tRNA formyltransferase [Alphaproteobacteria bacterium]|nr:methionyl-tRNA formyltransferase [Alphaproteobacteria bacterium]MDB9872867.1 methionyl-tRNA formyltransferase [Alphaproteobacteria bacterium]
MNIVFMGTPDFAVPTLELLSKHHNILAVYSQPPRPNGRGLIVKESPVQNFAKKLNIKTITPFSLKTDETYIEFKNLNPDIVVVVAYGIILPSNYLETPKYGCINGHASLLPRWRGAAPIQRAIEFGDKETGSCAMLMEKGMDTGPVILYKKIDIDQEDTFITLHDKLSTLTAKSLLEAIKGYTEGSILPNPQIEHGIKYAKKIEKTESQLDWSLPSQMIYNKIRALHPFPGTYTNGSFGLLKIIKAHVINENHNMIPGTIIDNKDKLIVACGENSSIEITEVQKPGKKTISTSAYLRGVQLNIGEKLGNTK